MSNEFAIISMMGIIKHSFFLEKHCYTCSLITADDKTHLRNLKIIAIGTIKKKGSLFWFSSNQQFVGQLHNTVLDQIVIKNCEFSKMYLGKY